MMSLLSMPHKGHHISVSSVFLLIAFIVSLAASALYGQTAPNTVITNQAKVTYRYKLLPADTVRSNTVQFTVLDAPNFEMDITNIDTLTFGKDTVTVRIRYKNIGNKIADSATIQGVLPPAGLKFIPGSTAGTISGNTVSWKVVNVPAGQTDSVKVKMLVDSGMTMNTELQLQASMSWLNSSLAASKTFVIAAVPRLTLNIIPEKTVVGSGRSLNYRIVVSNTGNTPSTNTVLYDTISSAGSLSTASIAPENISGNRRLVKWNLGSVPAFSSKEISIVVAIQPNIGHQSILNSGYTFSANVPDGDSERTATAVVPVLPKSMTIVPNPRFIFGQINKDSSRITVMVKDSADEAMPDGTPVRFTTSVGVFSNASNVVSTTLQNGSALATLRSLNVSNDIVASRITVVAGEPSIATIQDTTSVKFYPGAVTGIVVNGVNRIPFPGAIARVFNGQSQVVGTDTTKNDGKFFIPLNKDIAKYTLEILVIDKFGDSIKSVGQIDPSRFPLPPIVIPNIISGRIEYKVTGQPVAAKNVTVFLDSVGITPGIRPGRNTNRKALAQQTTLTRVQESVTDERGKFQFDNLRPAKYVISLDSAEFPNFNGFTFLTDTASGTFTINLSLQITLDSAVTLTTSAPAAANSGDTVNIGIGIVNSGTALHRSVTMIDTLSPFASFVSASAGNFSTVMYDTAKRVIRWQRDTLGTLQTDSVTVRYVVSRNIPDRTTIRNHVWFTSNVQSADAGTATVIRSSGKILFSNRFIVPQDTIIAGDSIIHVFSYKNIGTDSIRNVRIVDTLFSAGTVGISLLKHAAHDSLQIVDSISTVYIGTVAPGQQDSISLKLITDFALRHGSTVASHAYVMKSDSILAFRDTMFTVAEHPNLPSFITIVKTANKKVAEIGDIVTYQVQINNESPQALMNIGVYDRLPYAFRYVKNSARFNGRAVDPVMNPSLNLLTWNVPDTIHASKSITLVYQLAIGADALESEGVNTAYASAGTGTGSVLVSSPSQWQVTVRAGVFTEKGLIIGKIFYDDNRNTFQDAGENGVKGIELWMEDGTKIITGDDGKFSLPEVKPGQHVMRVNELTLPKKTSLIAGNNAFAKDPVSRFVRVTESGIAKANFYLKRYVADSIVQTVTKVNKIVAVRQAKPKYIFEDTLRKFRQDTVTMFVAFNYSGTGSERTIVINDRLDNRMSIVPNSATFNGMRINPVIDNEFVHWKLGRVSASANGVIRYSIAVNSMPENRTVLASASLISITAGDSIVLESGMIRTENVVIDTVKNRIETSDVITSVSDPRETNHFSDSVHITLGDDIYFKTTLYIDPKKTVKEAKFIDSLPSSFTVNERTFLVNGVPVPSRNLSLRVRSQAISSLRNRPAPEELEFVRISSLDLTDLLRAGQNEITYSARLQSVKKDTVYRKHAYAVIVDELNSPNLLWSHDAKIIVKAGLNSNAIALETTYVNIPRPSVKVEEKVAEAVKLVESLRSGSSGAVVMEGITFELSKASLTGESKVVLDNIAKILLENKDIRIQINGYTDNTGNATANRLMSLNRAKQVAAYLIGKGVDEGRLLPQGFGPAKPIASNKTEEGRSKNRRVEFAPLN